MSETVVKAPAESVTFEFADGNKLTVRPLETLRHLEDVETELIGKQGKDRYVFLDAVVEYFRERDGLVLSIDMADWVFAQLGLLYVKKKAEQSAIMSDTLKSPGITGD